MAPRAFAGFGALTDLRLDGNALTRIECGVFDGLTSLGKTVDIARSAHFG